MALMLLFSSSMVIDALDAGEARGMLTSNLVRPSGSLHVKLIAMQMSMREPRIAINGENAVLQYVRSHQGKEPSKTRWTRRLKEGSTG